MSSKLLECWWTASFRAMYISFCSVLKLTNDFEITDWNYIQVLRGKYPIRVRKIVYVIHRLCWINLISETNLASNMLLYKGCEIFVENTPQVHSSMKASFLFDRFTNISKSKVSSIFPCKSPESLKKYRGIIKQLDYCSIRTLTQCHNETLYSMIWNMYSKGYRHRFGNNFLFVLACSFFYPIWPTYSPIAIMNLHYKSLKEHYYL